MLYSYVIFALAFLEIRSVKYRSDPLRGKEKEGIGGITVEPLVITGINRRFYPVHQVGPSARKGAKVMAKREVVTNVVHGMGSTCQATYTLNDLGGRAGRFEYLPHASINGLRADGKNYGWGNQTPSRPSDGKMVGSWTIMIDDQHGQHGDTRAGWQWLDSFGNRINRSN